MFLSVYRLVYKRHKCKSFKNVGKVFEFCWFLFFFLFNLSFIQLSFSSLLLKISKSYATYGCCNPCFIIPINQSALNSWIYLNSYFYFLILGSGVLHGKMLKVGLLNISSWGVFFLLLAPRWRLLYLNPSPNPTGQS